MIDIRLEPLEPTDWSRAVGEFEEEPKEYKSPIFTFAKPFKQQKFKCNTLLIGVYGAGSCFLHSVFPQKSTIVGSLLLPEIPIQEATLGGNSINDGTCTLYQVTKDVVTVECLYHVPEIRCIDWTDCLFENVQSDRVIIFDKIKKVDYKGDSNVNPPLLKLLQTEKAKKDLPQFAKIAPYLKTPNVMAGLSAAIMTYCQVHKMSGSLFVSLESNHMLETETLQAFEPVLKSINLDIPKKPDYVNVLQQFSGRSQNPLFL